MYNFCTYFDRNYLHRGLTLYQSLLRTTEGSFCLWVLCLDTETFTILSNLNLHGLHPISLQQLEAGDAPLASAKKNRTIVEYFWTLSPCLPLHIFNTNPEIDVIAYIDADMYFFSSPGPVFQELGKDSILIVPHDYSEEYQSQIHSGKYNVGTMAFRSDDNGMSCLKWWKDRCIEWCYARHEDGKFGDQGYLNDWPERFNGVVVSKNIGLYPAPWNIGKYHVYQKPDIGMFIEDVLLICYHFHSTSFCTSWLAFLASWPIKMSREWRELIYRTYLQEMKNTETLLKTSGHILQIPTTGFPWRYIGGRILKRQPLRHFMLMTF